MQIIQTSIFHPGRGNLYISLFKAFAELSEAHFSAIQN